MRSLLGILLLFVMACQSTKQISAVEDTAVPSETLFTVDGESVLAEEFIYVYRKNNANNDSAFIKKDIDDYLELYKKFKLKISEAKNLGMDTTSSFRAEFNSYQDQLKKPYLSESQVTDQLVEEAYKRYKQEIDASHILIKLDANAKPQDTLDAYNKALEARERVLNGEDFVEVAKRYSDDPSVQQNGGRLGYFTSFQMVYPFESAAYHTDAGKLSLPVRTRFGYHVVKVNDKRGANGTVGVSHIMIRINRDKSDSVKSRDKIFEIYEQAQGGVPWEELTSQFSEDVNSKNNGGRLKPFTVGQMPAPFQEASFSLSEIGEISDPVMTEFGWHIIKLESKKDLPPLEELEENIKSRITRDVRAQLSKKLLIEKLKKENNFISNSQSKALILSLTDSALKSEAIANVDVAKTLFSIGNADYSISKFVEYFNQQNRTNKSNSNSAINQVYDSFLEESILAYEEDHLAEKYIDYRMLVKEYREGILLFQLMEDKIWSRAVDDTLGLEKFYEENAEKYQWGRRAKATIYNASNKEIIREISTIGRG